MGKVTWKGTVLTAPVPPVLVTCGTMETANIITVAWTGTVNTKPPMTYVSIRPSRHSYGIIKETGEFAVNLVPTSLVKKADYCGIYTGAKVDKFERCRLSKEPANEINCPILADAPVALECRVTDVISLGSHDMFLADIVAVDVEESLVGEDGKLHLERAGLIAYAHGDYYELGRRLGHFGYSVAKKKKPQRKKK